MKKDFKAYVILILGCILAFLIINYSVRSCINRNKLKTNNEYLKEDSLYSDSINKRIYILQDSIDSLKVVTKVQEAKLDNIKPIWKTIVKNSKSKNDTILMADTIIVTQDSIINEQKDMLRICNNISLNKDSIINHKNLTIEESQNVINGLNKQLKRKTNWWNRNKAWLGVGAGIIAGSYGSFMLLK